MRTGFLERTRSVEVTHRKEQRGGERERRKKTLDILVCWLSFSGIISALLSLSAYPPSLSLSLSHTHTNTHTHTHTHTHRHTHGHTYTQYTRELLNSHMKQNIL